MPYNNNVYSENEIAQYITMIYTIMPFMASIGVTVIQKYLHLVQIPPAI